MFQKVKEFLSPPVFDSYDKTRIASHIFLFAKVNMLVLLLAIPLAAKAENISRGAPLLVNMLVLFFFFAIAIFQMFLARKGYVHLAGTIYTIIVWISMNLSTLNTGGVQAVGFAGNLVVLVMAAMLINLRAVFIFGFSSVILGFVMAVLKTRGILPPEITVSVYSDWMAQTNLLVLNVGLLYLALSNIRRAFRRTQKAEKEVRQLNDELSLAYDTTLEGWARALELKDRETEGHSRRVTKLTKLLAVEIGVSKEALLNIHYGALLHDIGKMATPDEILHKPGALTVEERKIIEIHPVTAYNLLKEISYLEKAIEIPYCHHEKWDGTGYPRGLTGVEIPLAARIFTVIDVWDALNSDRSYRDAWPTEKILDYMKEQSGKHFDPDVFKTFFEKIIPTL